MLKMLNQDQLPNIIIASPLAPRLSIDMRKTGQVMQRLGVSVATIKTTTIYIDGLNHLITDGATYPNLLARLRYMLIPELRSTKGPIVRISSKVQGKTLSAKHMNRTLVHELEHVAQLDRHDLRRIIGHIIIWGLGAVGAVLGYKLAAGVVWLQIFSILIGAGSGLLVGNKIAPQERQARTRANSLPTSAIKIIAD